MRVCIFHTWPRFISKQHGLSLKQKYKISYCKKSPLVGLMTMEQGACDARTKGYGSLEKNISKRQDDDDNTGVIVLPNLYFGSKYNQKAECSYKLLITIHKM